MLDKLNIRYERDLTIKFAECCNSVIIDKNPKYHYRIDNKLSFCRNRPDLQMFFSDSEIPDIIIETKYKHAKAKYNRNAHIIQSMIYICDCLKHTNDYNNLPKLIGLLTEDNLFVYSVQENIEIIKEFRKRYAFELEHRCASVLASFISYDDTFAKAIFGRHVYFSNCEIENIIFNLYENANA